MTLQGRLFSEHSFPSPTEANPTFSAKSRCLIEMNGCFIVAPEGENLEPYQHSLYRLEVHENEIAFADDSQLSKDECKEKLEKLLDTLPYCDIVGVEYPFYAQGEIKKRVRKFRPCVALYGEYGVASLYIAAYMGAPRNNHNPSKFEMLLQAPNDIVPAFAGEAIVDCSKVCSFPDVYDREGFILDGEDTWKDFFVRPPNGPRRKSKSNRLKAANAQNLRKGIVDKLIKLLVDNPHMDYVDTTLKYDIGAPVEYTTTASNGEVCEAAAIYDPADYGQEGGSIQV